MNEISVKDRARKIIKQCPHSVLTTLDHQGFPQSRTMWTAGIDDDFTTYFVTGLPMEKTHQIKENSKVGVFWTIVEENALGWAYADVKGEVEISIDQGLRDRFWNEHLEQYYAGGKTDPNYIILIVHPKEMLVMDGMKYPLDRIKF